MRASPANTILIGIIVVLVAWFGLLAIRKPDQIVNFLERWTSFWITRAPGVFGPKRTIPDEVRAARRSIALGIIRLGGIFCLIWVALLILFLINA
ncbi:MAG: hypothetical protein NZ701_01940 [Roseiflexus sp.]|nr:hypothetical protein [Roseiflexus sp.]